MKNVIWLDRRRHLRLTPAVLAREGELKTRSDGENRGLPGWHIAEALWLFLIDEDPKLTVSDVLNILRKYLAGDRFGLRKAKLRRLRTRLGAMLQDYRETGV